METPFPGMDPYLEAPNLWPDVHHHLIVTIRDQLQAQLTPQYQAVITPYTALENITTAANRRTQAEAAILENEPPEVLPAPLTIPAMMVVPIEYARIEILTVRNHALVTVIELLSPAHKRPGFDGAHVYEQKRQEIFCSTANLLELDLLRAGQRLQTAEPLPDAPYFIFLSRMQRRPHLEIWPLQLREPIALIPVPLRFPDAPIVLDLSKAIHKAYAQAHYDLDINYADPPPAPAFSPEDAAWIDECLQTSGLRGG
ncbi:DUF4058 family protein [Candidatus Viridilinea mediisalina]|uniref:DUF4058 domain-containing protein n=1 Tax=Candidatus Viridilinea mediisalina TaxID=2024553 RepID=A0A2A6RHY1_9CHLR|nr:DUF4058 family protein [Candidatus Viridilinea mediisalina]PDW02478.1 hypothetical protein CJ255_13815 [Candidatus Viridilinea mediisalina]